MKRMRVIPIALLVALMLAIVCCTSRHEATFAHIDSLIEEHPDSALALLGNIDEATLTNDRDRAMYGLLYTQALSKHHFFFDNDSLISASAAYFKNHDKDDLYLRSLYYLADNEYQNCQYPKSMKNALYALEEAKKQKSFPWMAKCYELMGEIYNSTYLPDQNLECIKAALDCYRKAKWEKNVPWAMMDMACAYGNLKDSIHEKIYLDSVKAIAIETGDSLLLYSCAQVEVKNRIINKDYAQASAKLDTFENIASLMDMTLGIDTKLYKALIEIDRGKVYDKSTLDSLVSEVKSVGKNPTLLLAYDVCASNFAKQNKCEEFKLYVDSTLQIEHDMVKENLNQSVLLSKCDFLNEQAYSQREKNQQKRYIIIIISILSLIIIIFGLLWYKRRKTKLESRLHEKHGV